MGSGAAQVVLCGWCAVSCALLTAAAVMLIRRNKPVSRFVAACAVFLTARAAASLFVVQAALGAALTFWAAALGIALTVHHHRVRKELANG